ncbi:MAG: BatA domain-containing protein, partial [Planctomycetota bacterium]
MLAISFVTPLLLLGIAAAAIPLLLHLLSSVKAVETRFPSLRFLKLSMEKTARRRKIQHWLLMLLRAALLGLLAVAVAQPLSDAAGGWLGPSGSAAVIVLDNSYSMAAEVDGERRFDRARQMARRILTAENPPALAALMTTTGGGPTELTGDLTACQDRLDAAAISFGPDGLAQRVADGIDLLAAEGSAGTRALYILTDLQATSMQQLQRQRALAEAEGIHLLLIDTAAGRHVGNMGIVDLDVLGPRMVDAGVQVLVTVSNSSPTAQVAQVGLRIEGVAAGQTKVVNLAAAGRDGSTATLQFEHRFERPGPVAGEAYLLSAAGAGQVTDDLPIDNTRSFAIDVAERARALIVSPGQERQENPAYSPSLAPELLLGPRRIRWPIVSRTQAAAELSAESLQNVDIAYLCELPSFTPEQGRALAEFVAEGGKAVFFLGPRIDPDNYARSLVARAGPLLPVRPGRAVGQLGDQAEAIEANYVNLAHPYLAGLFAQRSDYLPNLLIQRYWQLQPRLNPMVAAGDQGRPDRPVEVLIRLANGDPLAIAAD